jgi:ubiquinone/menaquinone biosynthesis C-methylase UbiE
MSDKLELLLARGEDPHRPSVENRVAFQWERPLDTLGYRNATIRDDTILTWMAEAVEAGTEPKRVLDIGCGYGNHVLMLNARLGKDQDVSLLGVDLYPESMQYARSFAEEVDGFANCSFDTADIEKGLEFEDSTFDAVNIADVLEHLVSPPAAMREIVRVLKPGGTVVISTPLKTSTFKRLSALANKVSGGRIADAYYAGKGTHVEEGQAVMDVHVGHDHISEMEYEEIVALAEGAGCTVVSARMMPVMSGSSWFDRHPFLLSGLLGIEAIHEKLQRPSWAHGVVMRLRAPLASP